MGKFLRSLYVGRITEYLWLLVSKWPCILSDMSWANGFMQCNASYVMLIGKGSRRAMSSPPSSPPSSTVSSPSEHHNTAPILRLKDLLRETLRITIADGRIFLGTFVGTDSLLNVLLINTEEFRLGPEENRNGRYVGQVLIPWKLVVEAEALGRRQQDQTDEVAGLYL